MNLPVHIGIGVKHDCIGQTASPLSPSGLMDTFVAGWPHTRQPLVAPPATPTLQVSLVTPRPWYYRRKLRCWKSRCRAGKYQP
ncbi:hypothetical protein LZ30DRAFT_386259 [Colletotrichum cereale]|nr:hypothetical protein LZ30DRAFT_386259 [Colletotrichum cereale]